MDEIASKSGIRLHGADQAHREAMDRDESRLVQFDDQVSRHITLPARYWLAYDTLWDAWPYASEYFAACYQWTAEEQSTEAVDFEIRIREYLVAAIRAGWKMYNQDERGNSNDNPRLT